MHDKRNDAPSSSVTLAPLKTLFETRRGRVLPLPPRLARLYGCLRMPLPSTHPHVFSNFVTTLDGVGHIPMFEAPGRVTEVITDFVDPYVTPKKSVG